MLRTFGILSFQDDQLKDSQKRKSVVCDREVFEKRLARERKAREGTEAKLARAEEALQRPPLLKVRQGDRDR